MHTVYLIPGLGVDERLFQNIKLDFSVQYIKWQPITNGQSLKDYALGLSSQIDTDKPFSLLGVSFGGMCAVEIAKIHPPQKLILISSAKTSNELIPVLKILRLVPFHKYISDNAYMKLAVIFRRLFGIRSKQETELFSEMLKCVPKDYFKGAVNAIINWKNKDYPKSLLHLHGDRDNIIYYRQIKNCHKITGGTHLMVVDKAKEISEAINAFLLK